MMSQESVDIRPSLLHRVLLTAALLVFAQDLSSGGGAQAWTYNYTITPNQEWLQARQWCQEHFTDMVTIQSQEETDFISELLPYNPKYYWIGIHKVDGAWTRLGTDEIVPEDAPNWAPQEPDSIEGQDCVEIYVKRDKDVNMWNNEKCKNKKGTICYSASCTQESCSAHAQCVETIGNYSCRCHPGFQGPRCEEAIACKPLLDPEQGSHHCFHPYGSNRFNSSCRFSCELGFHLVGATRLLCQSSGHWNHRVPLCQVERCPVLNRTNSSGGRMNCSHPIAPYSYNSTCEVVCDPGYELSGDGHIHCDHSGQWTASVPACTIKKCGPVVSPPAGNVTCVDPLGPFSFGSWCDFTCQEGYYLRGNGTLTCLASGQWSQPPPTCAVVRCNRLEAPPRAAMRCQDPLGEHSYDSICTVQCEEGFDLIGANKTKCSSRGNWSHALPVCQAKRCVPQHPPSNGSLSCYDPNGSFSFGSLCTSTCDEGFVLNGTSIAECTALGTWSTDIPRCPAKRCPTLNSTTNGSLFCSHPHGEFSFGSRCTSSCEEGFLLNGTADTECTSLGTWDADPPLCTEFSFGSGCTSDCEDGFLLNGAACAECTSVGKWSAGPPHCMAKKCPLFHPPSHGSVSCSAPHGEFRFGSRCTSSCEEGFLLNGTADTECTSLGTWSADSPLCTARPCPLLAEAPQHGRMNCSHPYSPFSYDSRCGFGCTEGFWLRGTPTVTCNGSGLWSQGLPACELVQCEAIGALSLPLSVNCSHPLGNFSFGSQCRFTCKGRFSLNGTEVLLCSSTGFWSDGLPNCTEDLPEWAAIFVYTAAGVTSVLVPLILIGLAGLIFTLFKKKENPIMSTAPLWEETENPAFEF